MTKILIFFLLLVLVGCKDKYQEGYQVGYSEGVRSMELKLKESEEKIETLKRKVIAFLGKSISIC
jgi:hypothetical protein